MLNLKLQVSLKMKMALKGGHFPMGIEIVVHGIHVIVYFLPSLILSIILLEKTRRKLNGSN
jgi:hypothetical protein